MDSFIELERTSGWFFRILVSRCFNTANLISSMFERMENNPVVDEDEESISDIIFYTFKQKNNRSDSF
jgi:hypothetical protein